MKKIEVIFTNEKSSELSLKNVFLSKNNPRYNLLKKLDDDLLEFITHGDSKNEEKKTFLDLLRSEGDFLDFLSLLKSIRDYGYYNDEKIILIKDKNNNDSYVVAEGNRRVMALKLIASFFEFPDFSNFILKDAYYENENSIKLEENDIFNENEYENQNFRPEKNYRKCIDLVKSIRKEHKNKKFNISYIVINDSEDLWSQIYDKHLTGEKPGLRKWSRSKYFADLLSLFPKGIIQEDFLLIQKNIKRDKQVVKIDYKQAQFIYYCFYYGGAYETENDKKFFDPYILKNMVKFKNISSLETAHSFNKIRNIACEEILSIDHKEFEDTYFKIETNNKNHKIYFSENRKISENDMFSFIFDNWKNKVITTRPIKKQDIQKFKIDLSLLINNQKNLNNTKTEKELNKIEEFSLDLGSLKEIIEANENKFYKKPHVLAKFKNAKKIMENNEEIINTLEEKLNKSQLEPINVFKALKDQMVYIKNGNRLFLNALAGTIRSLIEQIVLWMNFNNEKSDFFKNEYIEKMSGKSGKFYYSTRFIKEPFSKNEGRVDSMIDYHYSKDVTKEKKIDHVKKWKEIILEKQNNDSEEHYEDGIELLNSIIHSSHRIYFQKSYLENNEKLGKLQDFIIEVLKYIDFFKFNELNQGIINKLKDDFL